MTPATTLAGVGIGARFFMRLYGRHYEDFCIAWCVNVTANFADFETEKSDLRGKPYCYRFRLSDAKPHGHDMRLFLATAESIEKCAADRAHKSRCHWLRRQTFDSWPHEFIERIEAEARANFPDVLKP